MKLCELLNKILSISSGKYHVTRIGKINTTLYFWKELLLTSKMLFIKIELLRDNPKEMDIDDFEQVVHQISDYDTQLIKNHLTRMKANK